MLSIALAAELQVAATAEVLRDTNESALVYAGPGVQVDLGGGEDWEWALQAGLSRWTAMGVGRRIQRDVFVASDGSTQDFKVPTSAWAARAELGRPLTEAWSVSSALNWRYSGAVANNGWSRMTWGLGPRVDLPVLDGELSLSMPLVALTQRAPSIGPPSWATDAWYPWTWLRQSTSLATPVGYQHLRVGWQGPRLSLTADLQRQRAPTLLLGQLSVGVQF